MLTIVFAAASLLQAAQQVRPEPWRLGGGNPDGYVTSTSGSAADSAGATIVLRSTTASSSQFASVSTRVPADGIEGMRLTVSASVDTRDASGTASLWIRADNGSRVVFLNNGADQGIRGTVTSARQAVTIFVPPSTTHLVFGVMLLGTGEMTARNLRATATSPGATGGPHTLEAQRVLDSAFRIVRRHSLWRDTVTWPKVEHDVRALAVGAVTSADVQPAMQALVARLGDHHSFFLSSVRAQAFSSGGSQNPTPVIRAEADGTGYVSVPAYFGAERQATIAYAQSLQDSIAGVATRSGATCRWIVDLRQNGGGNMWPMLGGLRPFLGDGVLGAFVSASGVDSYWHAADVVNITPLPDLAPLESANVAVLIGPKTASSGEAVAISFRGRVNTRLFGLPTAGLTTANAAYALPDGGMLFVTVSVQADRTGKRYGERIEPDQVVAAAIGTTEPDPQMSAAMRWLDAQPCAPTGRKRARKS